MNNNHKMQRGYFPAEIKIASLVKICLFVHTINIKHQHKNVIFYVYPQTTNPGSLFFHQSILQQQAT